MKSKQWIVALTAGALGLVAVWFLLRPHKNLAVQASSGYVDPAACHHDETTGYRETGMAHAFYTPTAAATIDSPAKTRTFYHAASATWYSVTARDGRFFERRWQKGFDGRGDNIEELSIDYVMGSGNHARTYLHREQDGTRRAADGVVLRERRRVCHEPRLRQRGS